MNNRSCCSIASCNSAVSRSYVLRCIPFGRSGGGCSVGWLAHYRDAHPPQVTLIASIESGPRQTTAPNQGQTATSVAIHMDALVAIDLYRRIGFVSPLHGLVAAATNLIPSRSALTRRLGDLILLLCLANQSRSPTTLSSSSGSPRWPARLRSTKVRRL
jgi:hypothetical protein